MEADTPWLVVGLLVLALVAFGLAAYGWRQGLRAPRRPEAAPYKPEEELDRLGISEVRARVAPRAAHAPAAMAVAGDGDGAWEEDEGGDAPTANTNAWGGHDAMDDFDTEDFEMDDFDETGVSAPRPVASPPPGPAVAPRKSADPYVADSPLWGTADPDAVGALLRSLAAALGAQSVALLRYDARADAYAVDALAGPAADPRTGPIPAENNALHYVPNDRSISLLEADALDALRYHARPRAAVGHAAALAVEGPADRVLLVVDGPPATTPFAARQLTLLGEYADLLGRLLGGAGSTAPGAATPGETPGEVEDAGGPEAVEPEPEMPELETPELEAEAPEETWPVRPRADIIAEEMAAARATERPLALALVVLRDTEGLENRGRAAVAAAERALFERLRRVEGSKRVERFGELLAGVFCHAGPTFAESWAERVAAAGPPVHIGVALLRARHLDAEALRGDAAAALRAAYEQGRDCVIME
jgi:hypothetical protein